MGAAAGLVLTMATIAACAPAASDAIPIQVALHDDAIDLEVDNTPSGRIALEIRNQGELVHEVEIFSGATNGQILPVRSSVAVTTGLGLIDEVENILAESRALLVVDLSPGTYLLICNLPAHYESGMWTYLTVDVAS